MDAGLRKMMELAPPMNWGTRVYAAQRVKALIEEQPELSAAEVLAVLEKERDDYLAEHAGDVPADPFAD